MRWFLTKTVVLSAVFAVGASAGIPAQVTAPALHVVGQGSAFGHGAPSAASSQSMVAPLQAIPGKGTAQQTATPVKPPSSVTTPRLTVTGRGNLLGSPSSLQHSKSTPVPKATNQDTH